MDTQNLKKLFEQASTEIPKDVLASISGKESLGVWRQGDDKGELVFCVNDIFYKAKTPSLDWDIFDYSTVLFEKRGVSNRPASYRIFGAGEEKMATFLQILKWTDFESHFPLYSFILSGEDQVSLRDTSLKVHSKTKTDILIFDENEGVVAKGFSYQASDSGEIVRLDRPEIDFVSMVEIDKFTTTSVTGEIGTPFSEMSFNGVCYRILHDHDDSKAKLLGRIPFEIADIKKTSPQLSNIDPEAFILAKTIFQKLHDNGSMIPFPEIVRGYPGANKELVQNLLNPQKGIFTKRYNCYGLTKVVVDYAVSHGWGTSPEVQYPLGGVGDARSEEVWRRIEKASSTQLSDKAPKGKTTEVEAAGVGVADKGSDIIDHANGGDINETKKMTTEIDFLNNNLLPYVKHCSFTYNTQDVIRFHTSVKCGMLTLIGGAPGTGKSSLVELYFRALGGREKNKEKPDAFCRIDVNPSWMEPADLLGYKDAKGVFQPADNGLYEFLTKNGEESANKQNNQDKDSLRLVCLEEINLACVEHYFSDFIQIISRGGGCLSIAGKAPAIVNEQVRIVGTCNSDETTHSMSLRLLDRCNYIELDIDEEARKKIYTGLFSQPAAKPLPFSEGEEITFTVYNSWRHTNLGKEISKNITDAFSALSQHFQAAGIAPSPRVVSDIVIYIHNRPSIGANGEQIPESDDEKRQWLAFDECVAQRILSQYRASPGTISAWTDIETSLGDKMTLSKAIVSKKYKEYKRMFD